MTGPRIDPYADLYAPASSQGPASPQSGQQQGGDPYADLFTPPTHPIPSAAGRDVTGTLSRSRFDTNAPLNVVERAAGQVVGFGVQAVQDPLGTAAGIITAPLRSADETFLRPVVGETVSGRYGKGGPLPGQLPPGTVRTPENSPDAISRQQFYQAGAQTVANVAAGPVAGAVGRVAGPIAGSVASLAPVGAAYSPDDPLAGAIAMPVIGGLIHQAGKGAVDPLREAIGAHLERKAQLARLQPGADALAGIELRRQVSGNQNTAPVMGRVAERETTLSRLSDQPKPEPLRTSEPVAPPEVAPPDVAPEAPDLRTAGVEPWAQEWAPHPTTAGVSKFVISRNTREGEKPWRMSAFEEEGGTYPHGVRGHEEFDTFAEAQQFLAAMGAIPGRVVTRPPRPSIEPREVALGSNSDPIARPDNTLAPAEARNGPVLNSNQPPQGVVEMPTSDIKVDAQRFQFKQDTDAQGVGKALKGAERWNPDLAGVVHVWRDPANGETYVVNGHHRRALAERTGAPTMTARFLDAADASEAKAKGAVINIAEGKGTAVDVAKFLRESKMSVDDLRGEGVDVRENLARDGVALSKLSADLFHEVATGKLPHTAGVAIGELLEDPALQREAATAVRGKRLSGDEVREVARQVRDAGTVDTHQTTLLGDETTTKGLYVERAQVANAIKKTITRDKALYGFLTKGGRAETIEQAGVGRVNVDQAQHLADQSARLDEVFTRLYTRQGALSQLLNEGAKRVASGEKAGAVAAELYPRIADAVRASLAESGTRVDGAGEGRPAAAPEGIAGDGADAERGTGVADSTDPAQDALFSRAPRGTVARQVGADLFGEPVTEQVPAQTTLLGEQEGTGASRSLSENERAASSERDRLRQELKVTTDPARRQAIASRLTGLDRLLNRADKISAEELQTRSAAGEEPPTTENLPGQGALFSRTPGRAATESDSPAPRRALASPTSPSPAGATPGAGAGTPAAAPATPTGPVVAAASGKFAQMRQTLRRIFAPASRTPDATTAAHVVRHHAADLALRTERAAEALKGFGKALGQMPEADRLEFIDRIETGKPQPTPDLTAAAAEIRHWLDTARTDIQALGTGALDHFIQDYFPHIWQDPKGAAQILNALDAGKRPLTGSGRFLKQRSIPTIKEGIAAGLTPISDNPVDLTLLKLREMHRYLAGQRILKELKEKKLLKFVSAFDPKPAGYTWLEDKTGTVYGPPHVEVTEAFDAHVREGLEGVIKSLGGLVHERKSSVGRHGPGTTLGVAQGKDYMATRGTTPDSVIEHELGHVLDARMQLWNRLTSDPSVIPELEALADLRHAGIAKPGASFEKYVRMPEEMVANAVNALIHIPDQMDTVAPRTKAALIRILGSDRRTAPLLAIKPSLVLGTSKFEVPTGGFVVRGRYAAPEPVATVVNNYLSPGLAGNAIYDAYRTVGNTMNQAQLGLSAFHLGMVSIDASVSSAALGVEKLLGGDVRGAAKDLARGVVPLAAPVHTYLQGSKVLREGLVPGSAGGDFPALVDAMRQGGGRVRQDQMYANEAAKRLREALRQGGVKGYAKAGAFALPALFEMASIPMMEHFVPRMKLGVFADLARHELAKLPPGATVEQSRAAMAKVWDSVDNRMGQLVYDNLFWHRVTKDMAMASIRSVGWNLGTIREIAGGVGDLSRQPLAKAKGGSMELTHRGAYVIALPFVIGLYGAALQYLMTGKGPEEMKDYFFPKTGRDDREGNPERVVLPSYMKDVFAYARHPYQTVKHKLHPLVGTIADMLENRDFFGNEIRNPDDPILKQVAQSARHIVGELEPMGLENARQEHAEGQSLGVSAANFVGVTRAPKEETRTPAQNRMAELLARRGGGRASPEEVEARRERSALMGDVRRGAAGASDRVGEAVRSGAITQRQAVNVLRSGSQDGTAERFKRLTLPEALEVYGMASPEERAAWLPLVGKKLQSAKRSSYTAAQWERIGRQAQQINTQNGAAP